MYNYKGLPFRALPAVYTKLAAFTAPAAMLALFTIYSSRYYDVIVERCIVADMSFAANLQQKGIGYCILQFVVVPSSNKNNILSELFSENTYKIRIN